MGSVRLEAERQLSIVFGDPWHGTGAYLDLEGWVRRRDFSVPEDL